MQDIPTSKPGPPPPHITTALLCDLTEYGADALRHQFINCYHRLKWATKGLNKAQATKGLRVKTSQLLHGGGWSEAACIRMLEGMSEREKGRDDHLNLPLYFTSGWTGNGTLPEDEVEQWRVCVYSAFASGLRSHLTRCLLNTRPGLGEFDARSIVEEMVVGGADSKECEVLDVAESKWSAWLRAIQLLETIFFSRRV